MTLLERCRVWILPWRFRFATWRFHRQLLYIIEIEHEMARQFPDEPHLHRVLCTRPDCRRTAVEVFEAEMVWPFRVPIRVITRCAFHCLAADTDNDFGNDGPVVIEGWGCS